MKDMIPDRIGDLLLDYDRRGRLHIRAEAGRISVEAEAANQICVQSSLTQAQLDLICPAPARPPLGGGPAEPAERWWIARDKDGSLYIYDMKPCKKHENWAIQRVDTKVWKVNDKWAPEVEWEDPEPRELILK